jgi:cytochrome c oxidase subunit II
LKKRSVRLWLAGLAAVVLGVIAILVIPSSRAAAQGSLGAICPPLCMVTFNTPSMFNPASIEALQIRGLFNFILVTAAVIFVLVEGLLFFAVFRFRNRPPEAAMQFHGNTKLELAWTAAPAVILAVLLGFTLQTMGEVKAVASSNVLNVKAIGHQWWWEFRYPDQNIITAEELVVPVNTNIEVAVESNDVEHGFWVPELFGKVDAVPGYTNRVKFTPITASQYYYGGQCTQFCGLEHAQMRFAVVVRTDADFKNWIAYQQQPPAAPETLTGDAADGQKLFASLPCVGCHTINGTAAAGVVGPNLTHLASRGFIAGGVLPNNADSLRAWIKDPQAVKPGNDMPTLGLSDSQVNQLVAYLGTLK